MIDYMTEDDLPTLCPVHSVKPEYAAAPQWCTCDEPAQESEVRHT